MVNKRKTNLKQNYDETKGKKVGSKYLGLKSTLKNDNCDLT